MAVQLPPALEKRLNKLFIENRLVSQILSFFFMPYLLKSGLKVNFDPEDFFAILPKRQINQNWYNTMGGAAILANLELAAGAYLFMMTRGDYRLVCKGLDYRFILPSVGAVLYKAAVEPEVLQAKLESGKKFDIDLDVKVYRATSESKPGKRMGGGVITFHVWPIGT